MSVEGESLAFSDETVPDTHSVNPADVDWAAIGDEHAASDGLLDLSHRTDALTQTVDGIETSRQANALLASAAEQGYIDEQDGDYYLPATDDEIDATDVDWHAVFESVAGGVGKPLTAGGKTNLGISLELGLDSPEEADRLVEDARDRGLITSLPNKTGLYLADGIEAAQTDSGPAPQPDSSVSETPQTRPELEALREDSDGMDEYVDQLEGLLTNVLDRLDAVEERQDRQDERVNEYVREKNEEQRVGLTELQIRCLRDGDMLSTDGVDMDALREEFGDDLVEVSGGSAVRLAEPKTDDSSRSTELPDFEDYCELEAERLKLHLQLRTPDDVQADGIYKYRCLTIWSNAETLATSNDEFPGQMVITKAQVESWLWKHARNGAKKSSMHTVCNRVMDEMADRTGGVIEKKVRNGNSVLVFSTDDLEDARCPRFQSRSLDGGEGGDLITPLL